MAGKLATVEDQLVPLQKEQDFLNTDYFSAVGVLKGGNEEGTSAVGRSTAMGLVWLYKFSTSSRYIKQEGLSSLEWCAAKNIKTFIWSGHLHINDQWSQKG